MAKKIIVWMGIILVFGMASTAIAGEGRLDFVETEVILFPDGKASIEYVVRWIVTASEFHGFCFSGFDRLTPRFDYKNAAGIDSRGNIYGLERIGDLAVNIVESALFLIDREPLKPFIDIPNMARIVRQMVKDSIDAFNNEDVKLAQHVCGRDQMVDDLKDQIFRELVTYMVSNPANIERAFQIIRIANSLERIVDLSTNLCEDVIYIVEGRVIKHHKDKDKSSFQ